VTPLALQERPDIFRIDFPHVHRRNILGGDQSTVQDVAFLQQLPEHYAGELVQRYPLKADIYVICRSC